MFRLNKYSKLHFSHDIEQRADPSFAKNGEPIREGKVKLRRVLGNDIRLAVYVKNSSNFLDKLTSPVDCLRFIKINDENISFNIRSLAKRLHLTREEIKVMAKEGKLQDFIDRDHQDLIHALNLFESLTQSNQADRNLVSTTGFSNTQLMRLSKLAIQRSKKIQEGQSRIISIFDHQFILEKIEGKIQLTHVYGYKNLINLDYRTKLQLTLGYLEKLKDIVSGDDQNDKKSHKIYFIAGTKNVALISCDSNKNIDVKYVRKFLQEFLMGKDSNIIDKMILDKISNFRLESNSIDALASSISTSLGE